MRPFRLLFVASGVVAAATVAACVGDTPNAGTSSGSTSDAGSDDTGTQTSSDSGGPGDGGGEAAAADAGFCGDHPSAALCEDFDHGDIEARGWINDSTAGSTVQLVASPRSAPYALEAIQAGVTGNAGALARVKHSFAIPSGATHIHVEADIHFGKRDGALSPCSVMYMTTNEFAFDLSDNGPKDNGASRQLYIVTPASDGGVAYVAAAASYPVDWARYEVDVTRSGSTVSVTAKRDGVTMTPGQTTDLASASMFTGGVLNIGAGTGSGGMNGETEHDIDNVLVTVE